MTNLKLARRKFLHLAAGAAALPVASRVARAQSYPTRAITMMVPFVAGGSPADWTARIMAERMQTSLGQPVVVENVATASGAGSAAGTGRIARAERDGYTLGIGSWNTHVANAALYMLPYDVVKDFEPVSLLVSYPTMIVANNTIPAKTLKELIEWLKANPDRAAQGTPGVGSVAHLGGLNFQMLTGTRFRHATYSSPAAAMRAVVAGQIELFIGDPTVALPELRAGRVQAYAVTAATRLPAAPLIPTVDEAGLPEFHASNWHAFWVPAGTPKSVISKLNAAVIEALADPGVRARLADLGQQIFPRDQQTPEALAAFQKAEIERWWPIIKAANIKGQ
jgi:tripartite-type tricarboxylate transporter receptor subunit TctC